MTAYNQLRFLALLTAALLLSGCFTAFGPVLQNGFGADIGIYGIDDDGLRNGGVFPPCAIVYAGADSGPSSGVNRIVIEKNSEILYEISRDEIIRMNDYPRPEQTYFAWVLEANGVFLRWAAKANSCPDFDAPPLAVLKRVDEPNSGQN